MSFITVKNIRKSFGDHVVLHDVHLSAHKGELITLLGPSGCGKSTLLRIMAGLTSPDSGTIEVDGKDITHLSPTNRQVGMVFQSYALFPNMNVEENIAFGLKMKKLDKRHIRQKVAEMIELVELTGKEKAYPRELSGGQQQRVALARSLVTEPKVLLLDEPLSALDAQIRKNLQKQLRSIQRELHMTMVLVTHDQEEAMAVSDRIYILNAGHIVQCGTPDSIYSHPANEFVARFIGNYNVLTREELTAMIGNNRLPEGKLFAIRPEALSSDEGEYGYRISGKVARVQLLGNIIRYELVTEKGKIVAEHLYEAKKTLQEGVHRTLFIHQEDVIPLA